MSAFKNLSWGTRNSKSGMNPGIIFLLGSAIGGAAAYLFLTEKGAVTRKKIIEKVGNFSPDDFIPNIDSKSQEDDIVVTGADHSVRNEETNTEDQTPSTKAQNMVSHLKQK